MCYNYAWLLWSDDSCTDDVDTIFVKSVLNMGEEKPIICCCWLHISNFVTSESEKNQSFLFLVLLWDILSFIPSGLIFMFLHFFLNVFMKKRLYKNEIAPITDTHNKLLVTCKVITQVNTNYWLLLFAYDLCKSCKKYIQIIYGFEVRIHFVAERNEIETNSKLPSCRSLDFYSVLHVRFQDDLKLYWEVQRRTATNTNEKM